MTGEHACHQWTTRAQQTTGIQLLVTKFHESVAKMKIRPSQIPNIQLSSDQLVELSNRNPADITLSFLATIHEIIRAEISHSKRKLLRIQMNLAIIDRAILFKANRLRRCIQSVLQVTQPRFNFFHIVESNGDRITDPEIIQTTINTFFKDWHATATTTHPLSTIVQNLWREIINGDYDLLLHPNIPPHLSQLFTDALLLSTNIDELRAGMESSLLVSPTYENFLKHVKGKAKNKSPGITSLSINMIHCLPPSASQYMYDLLLTMWSHRYVPPWWKHHWRTLVPKTTDIHVTLLKLRPICLLEVTRKIWLSLIIRKTITVWIKYSALDDS
jgi:hypothetical protein